MRRRVYVDETVWLALACEGELRDAVRGRLRSMLEDGWTPVTSTFALDRMVGLEDEAPLLLEYLSLVRRIVGEIIPLLPVDFERAAQEVLAKRVTLSSGVHLAMARRSRCDGICSFSSELVGHAPGTSLSPI